jgi:alditol oxidase
VTLRNWAGNVVFGTDRVHRPSTVEQLQDVVAAGDRIRAIGTRHSFNRIADTTGELVSVADLDLPIVVDERRRTVDVGGGIRYGELTAELETRGWALHNLGSLPHISVAGACATGTHGSGNRNGCLATAVQAIEFVRADGELVRSTRDDPSFSGSVVALGALGVVTRLTLAIEPSYQLRQDVWLDAPLDTVLADLAAVTSAGYSVSLFLSWSRPDVVDQIWLKTRGDGPVTDGRVWGAHAAETAVHPIPTQDAGTCTEQLGRPGPWNARLPHFRLEFTPSAGEEQQTEFLLPREHGPAALDAVRGLDLARAVQVCEVRTVAADGLWLSPFHDRDSIGIHFTWVDDDDLVQPAVAALESALAPFDPRPHWGKVFRTGRAESYPRLAAFRDLAAHHDPGRKFGNPFLERYVYG